MTHRFEAVPDIFSPSVSNAELDLPAVPSEVEPQRPQPRQRALTPSEIARYAQPISIRPDYHALAAEALRRGNRDGAMAALAAAQEAEERDQQRAEVERQKQEAVQAAFIRGVRGW
jgi:hypothetical protein